MENNNEAPITEDAINKIDSEISKKVAEEQQQIQSDFESKVQAEVEARIKAKEEQALKLAEEQKAEADKKAAEEAKEKELQSKFDSLENELKATKKELEDVSLRRSIPNVPQTEQKPKEMSEQEKIQANKEYVSSILGMNI